MTDNEVVRALEDLLHTRTLETSRLRMALEATMGELSALHAVADAARSMVRKWPSAGCLHESNVRLRDALTALDSATYDRDTSE